MTSIADYRTQTATSIAASIAAFRLPWFLWIPFVGLAGVTILVVTVIIAAHGDRLDMLSAFDDLFARDVNQLAQAHGFACQQEMVSGYCARQNTDALFPGLYIRRSASTADEVTASIRKMP